MKLKSLIISSALLCALPAHADIKTTLETLAVQLNKLRTALMQGKPYEGGGETGDVFAKVREKAKKINQATTLVALVDLWGDGQLQGGGYSEEMAQRAIQLLGKPIEPYVAKQLLSVLADTPDASNAAFQVIQIVGIDNKNALDALDAYFIKRFGTPLRNTDQYKNAVQQKGGYTGGAGGSGETVTADKNKKAIIAAAAQAQTVEDLIKVWQMCNEVYQTFTLPGDSTKTIVPEIMLAIERVLGLKDIYARTYDSLFADLTKVLEGVDMKARSALSLTVGQSINTDHYIAVMNRYFEDKLGKPLIETPAYAKFLKERNPQGGVGGGTKTGGQELAAVNDDSPFGQYFNSIRVKVEPEGDPLVAYRYIMEGDLQPKPQYFESTPYAQNIKQFIAKKFGLNEDDLGKAYTAAANAGYFLNPWGETFFTEMDALSKAQPNVFKIIADSVRNQGTGTYDEVKQQFKQKKALDEWFQINVTNKDINAALDVILQKYPQPAQVPARINALFRKNFNKTVQEALKEREVAKEKSVMPVGDKLNRIVKEIVQKINDSNVTSIFDRLENAAKVVTADYHLDKSLVDKFFQIPAVESALKNYIQSREGTQSELTPDLLVVLFDKARDAFTPLEERTNTLKGYPIYNKITSALQQLLIEFAAKNVLEF